MHLREPDLGERTNVLDEVSSRRKGGWAQRIFRALMISVVFVLLVVVFVGIVLVVAVASGVPLGACSSGVRNPVV